MYIYHVFLKPNIFILLEIHPETTKKINLIILFYNRHKHGIGLNLMILVPSGISNIVIYTDARRYQSLGQKQKKKRYTDLNCRLA